MPAFDGVRLDRGQRGVDVKQLRRVMARSTALEQFVQHRIEDANTFAMSISPDATPIGRGYKFRFRTTVRQQRNGVPIGILRNSSPIWIFVEKGTGHMGPYAQGQFGPNPSQSDRPQGGYSPAFHVFTRTIAYLEQTSR